MNAEGDWRPLRCTNAPVARQFALSEALLTVGPSATGRPALRWYLARQPALILGNGQQPEDADLPASREAGVTVFRRTSGGTAVLLDEDAVNLEVTLPAGHPLALSPDQRAALTQRLRDVTAGLDELAGRAVSASKVMATVEAALASRLGITLKAARPRGCAREAGCGAGRSAHSI